MTPGHDAVLPVTAERLTRALLEVAETARWPDGSLLLDLDSEVLRAQLAPQLLAALVDDQPGPSPAASPTRSSRPHAPSGQPPASHARQGDPC